MIRGANFMAIKRVSKAFGVAGNFPSDSPIFSLPVRIYYEDTDSGGIVYYANYLKFMERARTEFLRGIGFEQDTLSYESKRLFVVKNITVNYVKPARFNALLDVTAQLSGIRPASMSFIQEVYESGTLLCDAVVQLACLNVDTMKPARIPTEVLEALSIER